MFLVIRVLLFGGRLVLKAIRGVNLKPYSQGKTSLFISLCQEGRRAYSKELGTLLSFLAAIWVLERLNLIYFDILILHIIFTVVTFITCGNAANCDILWFPLWLSWNRNMSEMITYIHAGNQCITVAHFHHNYPFTMFSNLRNTMFLFIQFYMCHPISVRENKHSFSMFPVCYLAFNVTTIHSNIFHCSSLLSCAECHGFWCCSLRSSVLRTIQCNYSWSRVTAVRVVTKQQFPSFIIRNTCTSGRCTLQSPITAIPKRKDPDYVLYSLVFSRVHHFDNCAVVHSLQFTGQSLRHDFNSIAGYRS
jgi:hypothetical protein